MFSWCDLHDSTSMSHLLSSVFMLTLLCHSQRRPVEVVPAALLPGLAPLLLPLQLTCISPLAILAGRITLNMPPSVWHKEVFLTAKKRHFVLCILLPL